MELLIWQRRSRQALRMQQRTDDRHKASIHRSVNLFHFEMLCRYKFMQNQQVTPNEARKVSPRKKRHTRSIACLEFEDRCYMAIGDRSPGKARWTMQIRCINHNLLTFDAELAENEEEEGSSLDHLQLCRSVSLIVRCQVTLHLGLVHETAIKSTISDLVSRLKSGKKSKINKNKARQELLRSN